MGSPPPLNSTFAVRETAEFRDAEGKLIARYMPELSPYRVTLKNAEFVGALVGSGKAVVVGMSRARRPAGAVKVTGGG